jgi:heptosyltransferase-3
MIEPQSILVINVSRIGDTLLATPAIRALAATWPQASVDVLGHRKRIEVLQHLPFVRRVGPISRRSASFRGWLDCLAKPYDLAIVYGFDQSLVAYALRVARHVAAFRQRSEGLNRRLATKVEPPAHQSGHSVQLALALPAALGVISAGLRLSYAVTVAEQTWATATLARDLPDGAAPLIGLQIASFPTKAYRDWPIEYFIELCERIREFRPKAHILIFGGPAEHLRTEALKTKLGKAATLYAGKLSLRQTGALISRLDLFIGVDTGPTHLASALDIPLIGLYHGFSRSELVAPLEHPCFIAIDHPLAGPDCSTDASMADISVDTVWHAVEQLLTTSLQGPRHD